MKETLKTIYQTDFIENVETFDFDNYYYFIDNQTIFGIKKSALTPNEKRLIESQYNPFDLSSLASDGLPLFAYLFGRGKAPVNISKIKYYFIRFFSLLEEELQHELFTVIIDSFEQKVYINRKRDVVIIVSEDEGEFDFSNLLSSIEADFMINILGFESNALTVNSSLPQRFQFDLNTFMDIKYREDKIITKADLVKHYVLNQLDSKSKQALRQYVLQDFQNDPEMLKVITSYFESNFNVTLAAKRCYMHRNTFQNKLDKFIAETHFNIREYSDAFIVYLVLQL